MLRNLAIIPARGGSKRIPRKNIKSFLGKPIIAYSIEKAINSKLFEEVMVSTEDEEIALVAKKYGATIPFMRDKDNANDFAGLSEVIEEVVRKYSSFGKEFKYICCILPTAPLTTIHRLKQAFDLLLMDSATSVIPVVAFSYPPSRSLIFDKGKLKMKWPEYLQTRSQDLPELYHDAGAFYWLSTQCFLKEKSLFTSNGTGLKLNELEVQDIDTEIDWKLAELKYNLLNE